MAPSIAARYLTRGLARAANNVCNKETGMRVMSGGARYITRRQLSQEARAANNGHTMEAPKIGERPPTFDDSKEPRAGRAGRIFVKLALCIAVIDWHSTSIKQLEEKYGFKVVYHSDGASTII